MSGNDSETTIVSLPDSLLDPLRELGALYKRYGSVPRAIFALISLYIVNGALSIGSFVVGSVLAVFDFAAGSIRSVQLFLINSFGAVGVNILGIYQSVVNDVASVIQLAGPLGPPIAAIIGGVLIYGAYRLTVAALGELPLGSSLVDLLGVR